MKTLDQIMLSYKTDKSSKFHDYCNFYERYLLPFRDKYITFIEIGLGNLDDPNQGASILGWRDYFHNAQIIGIDIDDKSFFNKEERIQIFQGSQDDVNFLQGVVKQIGKPTVICEDGCHHMRHMIVSFETLFPLMESGGVYLCEDVHTNYWSGWEGSPITNDFSLYTVMNYFFNLCHSVNLQDPNVKVWPNVPNLYYHTPSFYKDIESITFHRSLIIVKKK